MTTFGVEILLSKGISTNPLELTQEAIADVSPYKEPFNNLREESKDFSAKLLAAPLAYLGVQSEDSTHKLVKDLNKVKNLQELPKSTSEKIETLKPLSDS